MESVLCEVILGKERVCSQGASGILVALRWSLCSLSQLSEAFLSPVCPATGRWECINRTQDTQDKLHCGLLSQLEAARATRNTVLIRYHINRQDVAWW